MLRKCLFVVLALCLVGAGRGWAKPAFGIRGGLNMANASVKPKEWRLYEGEPGVPFDVKSTLGVVIGEVIEFPLTETKQTAFILRLEGLYVQKGFKESPSKEEPGYEYEATWAVDELVLAPFAVLRIPMQGVTPFVQAGPELGIRISGVVKVEETYPDYEGVSHSETDKSYLENWSHTNFGLNIGGGVAVPAGKGEVVFDVRYNLGLTNMHTYKEEPGEEDTTVKTNGIQIMVGYNFSIPTK